MNIMKATNDEKQKLIAKSDALQNQLVEQITPLTADHKKLITQHREGLLSLIFLNADFYSGVGIA